MQFIEVLIPVLNEAENIPLLVSRLDRTFKSAGLNYRLFFIDDNSTDNTLSVLKKLSSRYPIEILLKMSRQGKAYSILESARHTTGEILAMIDGDLQYPPEAIPAMLKAMKNHGVVVANRKTRKTSFLRNLVSRIDHLIFARLLHGFDCDTQSGLKLFRRDILDHLNSSDVDPWALDMPLLHTARDLGYSIGSVDVDFSQRAGGVSKINFFKASWQIATRSIKLKFTPRRMYTISSNHPNRMHGSGVIYRGRKYITHTHLEHHHSALSTLQLWQKIVLTDIFLAFILGLVLNPVSTLIFFISILSVIYFIDVLFNLFLVSRSLTIPPEYSFSPAEIKKIDEADLPLYSILCPLYHEAKVLPEFTRNIAKLDWPKSKLEVLLLLEENDKETITVAQNLGLPKYFRIIIVPDGAPKTKPKACNYGLSFVRGKYVVIYDAEDRPEVTQLKKAYLTFQSVDERTVCLQAKLNYYNPGQNLLTRLFTAEYSLWFDVTLPGLQSIHTTIPLGGTSNHFKSQALRDLRGWDAFNVTEDADLGARLFKMGYRTAIINSTTLEEANSNLGNWLRQRSRWIKGYIQTYLVHNRHPRRFFKQHGIHALIFQLVVGGKIAFMLINPVLWLTTIAYFTAYALVGPAIESLFPPAVFYLAGFSAVFGNFLFLFYYMLGCARRGHWNLVKHVFFIPFYWVMISLAAAKALFQLIVRPHYWEKTRHGLNLGKIASVKVSPVRYTKSYIRKPGWGKSVLFFTKNRLFSGATLVIANGFGNLLNLLYNLFLGRHLSLEDFGLISLIAGLNSITQIPFFALGRTVTYRSAYLKGKFSTVASDFWTYIRSRVWLISIIAIVLWLLAIPVSAYIFKSPPVPLLLFSPILLLGLASAVDTSFLSGSFRFSELAVLITLESVVKLSLSIFFVFIGQPQMVYAALPISFIAAYFVSWFFAKKTSHQGSFIPAQQSHFFPGNFFASSVLVRISQVASLGMDIILAKILLSPADAGRFAIISVVGKMIFFSGNQVSQFITPAVSHAEGKGTDSKKTFTNLLLGSALASLLGWLIFGLFGYITAPILMGSKALSIISYLPLYGFSVMVFTIGNNIINFHHIKHHFAFPYIGIFLSIVEAAGIGLFHQNLTNFVNVIVVSGIVYLTVLLITHLFYSQLKAVSRNLLDLFKLFQTSGNGENINTGKLKILIFNWRDIRHLWAGGAEVYVHELAKRWVADGHKVTVFCGQDGKNLPDERIDGVRIIRRGGFYTVYLWAIIYYLVRLRGHFDVVIDSENGIPFFSPLFAGVPVFLLIYHVHQNVFRRHLKFPLREFALFMESRVMPLVYRNQKIITISNSSKKDLVSLGFAKNHNISIVSPGVDLIKYHPGKKTDYPSFLYLGRIRPYKNVDISIKAFAQVHTKFPKAILNIAGWGENLGQLRKLVSELHLTQSVKFHEKVSEEKKSELLRSAWVMIQPSSFEGWGITVIEAAASGTATIASNVIGLRDSVINQETGLLVSEKNINSLADSMIDLVVNPAKLSRLSNNSLTWSKKFDWDIQSKIMLKYLINMEYKKPKNRRPFSIFPSVLNSENINTI